MNVNISQDVLNYLKEKNVKDIKLYLESTKGSKWCPITFDVQVELLIGEKKQRKGEKVVYKDINIYIDESVPKNKNYRIFKVLKVPFFPMIIGVEKVNEF